MKYQSTRIGEIIEGDDPQHPDVAQRARILDRALNSWGWEAAITHHKPRGRFIKFSAQTKTPNIEYQLEIFIFPNLADSARNRPYEKRIQITREYDEHKVDFELPIIGDHRCLLLGFYVLSDDDVVICAWNAAAYRNHATPTSCYVDINTIGRAFHIGFDRWRDSKGNIVCCFRPEFMHYYIENMARLHEVGDDVEQHPQPSDRDLDAIEGGENIIFYGAPGTGKTHQVDQRVGGELCVRTVFHPDLQNSDFVGALKPVMREERVSYSFSPGPFALALRNALLHPDQETYLVIEELNRAPAAAVFGDLFLLLDRDDHGAGKYDVDFPTPEFHAWLGDSVDREIEKLSLPSNMWLLATMNSADQGVYPIDTAFRRRWRQEYIPIDYGSAPDGMVDVALPDGEIVTLEWREFARTLNEYLTSQLSIAEDRLLGPWFVTTEELASTNAIASKVLIYLWDDLLRHHGREQVFDLKTVKTFGEVSSHVEEGKRVFSDDLLAKIRDSHEFP